MRWITKNFQVQLFQTLNSKYEIIQDMLRRSTAVAVECGEPYGQLRSLGNPGHYKHLWGQEVLAADTNHQLVEVLCQVCDGWQNGPWISTTENNIACVKELIQDWLCSVKHLTLVYQVALYSISWWMCYRTVRQGCTNPSTTSLWRLNFVQLHVLFVGPPVLPSCHRSGA